jgi:hypothetical protein
VSLLVLLWEVASELHLRASDTRVVFALLLYLAGGAVLGWLLAIGVPAQRRPAIVLPTAMRDFAVAAGHHSNDASEACSIATWSAAVGALPGLAAFPH